MQSLFRRSQIIAGQYGFLTAFLFVMLVFSLGVLAQQVEEVVVEAQEQDNAILETDASVSAIDGEKLADAGISDVSDVAAYVPNLSLTQTSQGTNIVIRGIGSGVNQGFDQSVGLYIDEVPLPRSQMARAPFLDLEGVQVLRGGQYVRDGNYSLAGSIHLLTQGASDEFKVGLDTRIIPSQNERSLLLTMGAPIGGQAGLRLAIQKNDADGYMENLTLNRDEGGSDETLARAVFTFKPTDESSLKLKVEHGEFKTTGRAAEVILDTPTPNVADLDFGTGVPGYYRIPDFYLDTYTGSNPGEDWTVGSPNRNLSPTFSGSGDALLFPRRPWDSKEYSGIMSSAIASDLDYALFPYGIRWDAAANRTINELAALDPDVPGFLVNDNAFVPLNGGRSYFQVWRDFYTGVITGPYADQFLPQTPALDADGVTRVPVPRGLDDTSLDFRRGVDAEEFSNNTSLNITLNADQYFGEHRLKAVASVVDYEYEELVDADLSPVPIVNLTLGEDFEQNFFRLEYESPRDASVRVNVGASYLDSELEYREDAFIFIDNGPENADPENPNNIVAYDATNAPFADSPGLRAHVFNPRSAGSNYFGRIQTGLAFGFSDMLPQRRFNQSTEIKAAFFDIEFDITEDFNITLGGRYTEAIKMASRELKLVHRDGSDIDIFLATDERDSRFPEAGRTKTLEENLYAAELFQRYSAAHFAFAAVFGFQPHSDDYFDQVLASDDPLIANEEVNSFVNDNVVDGILTQNLATRTLRGDRTERQFLPSLTMRWNANEWATLRFAARMANKLGGFDARASSIPDLPQGRLVRPGTFEFEDETSTSYEIGGNFFFPNGSALNATLFYSEFEDLQVSTADGRLGTNVRNAGKASSLGLEFEGIVYVNDAFNITYSGAWIDFEFKDFDVGSCPFGRRPDYVLLRQLRGANLTPPVGQALANRLFPDAGSDEQALESFNRALEGDGFLLPVEYGTELFVGGVTDLVSYEYGFVPLLAPQSGQTLLNNVTDNPERVALDGVTTARYVTSSLFDNARSPVSPTQWNSPLALPVFCDFEGQTNQYVAEFQSTIGFNFTKEIPGIGLLKPSLDVIYNSGYETTVQQASVVAQDEYFQFNGRISLESREESWEIALVGENLTNQKIVTFADEMPFAVRLQGAESYFGFVRPGRSVGLNFRYTFY